MGIFDAAQNYLNPNAVGNIWNSPLLRSIQKPVVGLQKGIQQTGSIIQNAPRTIAASIYNPPAEAINNVIAQTNQALEQNKGNPLQAATQATGALAKNTIFNPSVVSETASFAVPFGRGANFLTKSVLPGAVSGGIYQAGQPGATPENVGESALFGGATAGLFQGAGTLAKAGMDRLDSMIATHPELQQGHINFSAPVSVTPKPDFSQPGNYSLDNVTPLAQEHMIKYNAALQAAGGQDATIPKNISDLIYNADVSQAKNPNEMADAILKQLPPEAQQNERVVTALKNWGKSAQMIVDNYGPGAKASRVKTPARELPIQPPKNPMKIEAYHGEGQGRSLVADAMKGNATFGEGEYYSTDPRYAGIFGKPSKETVSFNNPLIIRSQEDLNSLTNEAVSARQTLDEWARQQGFDGIYDKLDDTIVKFAKKVPPSVLDSLEKELHARGQKAVNFLKSPEAQEGKINFLAPIAPKEKAPLSPLGQQIETVNRATTPLSQFESATKGKRETMGFFDKTGNKVYQTQPGGQYTAKIPTEDLQNLKGTATVTSHNHQLADPNNPNSPLNEIAVAPDKYDMQKALENGVKEVRTTSPIGTTSVKFPDNLDQVKVQTAFHQASIDGENAYRASLARGENPYYANVARVKAENDAITKGLGAKVTRIGTEAPLQKATTFLKSKEAQSGKIDFLAPVKAIGKLFGKPEKPLSGVGEGMEKPRGFTQTVQASPQAPQRLKDLVSGTYNVKSNTDLINAANTRIAKDPVGATHFATNTNSDEATATAIQLVKKLSNEKNYQAAADIVNTKAEQLTEAGRTIQAASLFDSLSPEGVGQLAARTIQKYNIIAKQKIPELTGAQLKAITDMAKKVQSLPVGREKVLARQQLLGAIEGLTPKHTSWFGELLNLPRAMRATFDLSAPLRQGVFLIGHPKQFGAAFGKMMRYALSEKSFQNGMADIQLRPNYDLMQKNKLALTDPSDAMLTRREEAFMSNFSEKIPVFGTFARASNRAYTGFLNELRANTFDELYQHAQKSGVLQQRPEVTKDIAKFVNTASGRGDLGALERAAVTLNGAFFSPRLMASRLNLLNPMFYVKLDPFVRKEALKTLLTFAGTEVSILSLAKLGGASVGTDPRSADFLKIKMGNTRYDPWGGFQQYLVAGSRLLTGQMVSSTTGREINLGEGYKPTTRLDIASRALESKASPVASFILGLLRGQTGTGDKFNAPAEIADFFIPMIWQDLADLSKEKGIGKGLLMDVPGLFGTGVQTYANQIPMKGKTATGKPNIQWQQPPTIGENIINKLTGKQLSDIPESEWPKLQAEKQQKALQQIDVDRAKAQVLETGNPQTIGNKLIYLKSGIVTIKKIAPKNTKSKGLFSSSKSKGLFKSPSKSRGSLFQ